MAHQLVDRVDGSEGDDRICPWEVQEDKLLLGTVVHDRATIGFDTAQRVSPFHSVIVEWWPRFVKKQTVQYRLEIVGHSTYISIAITFPRHKSLEWNMMNPLVVHNRHGRLRFTTMCVRCSLWRQKHQEAVEAPVGERCMRNTVTCFDGGDKTLASLFVVEVRFVVVAKSGTKPCWARSIVMSSLQHGECF